MHFQPIRPADSYVSLMLQTFVGQMSVDSSCFLALRKLSCFLHQSLQQTGELGKRTSHPGGAKTLYWALSRFLAMHQVLMQPSSYTCLQAERMPI
uniref:Uncharacterized protein n=1 Tax=Arundo donax TaxID=35708 RepID=A0A0A9EQS2_ARUDO